MATTLAIDGRLVVPWQTSNDKHGLDDHLGTTEEVVSISGDALRCYLETDAAMVEDLNEVSEAEGQTFDCWPAFSPVHDDEHFLWKVFVLVGSAGALIMPRDEPCHIRITGTGLAEVDSVWCPASRINNPIDKVDIRGRSWSDIATFDVAFPAEWAEFDPPPFEDLFFHKDSSTHLKYVYLADDTKLTAVLYSSPRPWPVDWSQLQPLPRTVWKWENKLQFENIHEYGARRKAELEAIESDKFNMARNVYRCWSVTSEQVNPKEREHIMVVDARQAPAAFPPADEYCHIGFTISIPVPMDDDDIRWCSCVRIDNPTREFALQDANFKHYATFKVVLPGDERQKCFTSLLSGSETGSRLPQATLADDKALEVYFWRTLSTTTRDFELKALNIAMAAAPSSRLGKAFEYLMRFDDPSPHEYANLLTDGYLPDMRDPESPSITLPQTIKDKFNELNVDQKRAYHELLSHVPHRVLMFTGASGCGKSHWILMIAAMSCAAPKEKRPKITILLEANQPANDTANRASQLFKELGNDSAVILRPQNRNYEGGIWATAKELIDVKPRFQSRRAARLPQIREGRKGELLVPTLTEGLRGYLHRHKEEYSALLTFLEQFQSSPSDFRHKKAAQCAEYQSLFDAACHQYLDKEVDMIVTTPVAAAKMAAFMPKSFKQGIVIQDEATRAGELCSLMALSFFPAASVWIFVGCPEQTKPYVMDDDYQEEKNICREQLQISTMERAVRLSPPLFNMNICYRMHGDLHKLPSELFFAGELRTPNDCSSWPDSTQYLMSRHFENFAGGRPLRIPRLLVEVPNARKGEVSTTRSPYNQDHIDLGMHFVKDLVLDPEFLAVGSAGGVSKRGSILVTTPYVESANRWKRARDDLIRRLDKAFKGNKIHRDVEVEVRTQGTISGCEYDVVIHDMVSQNLTAHMEVANKWCVALTRAIQGEIIIMHPGMKDSPGFKDGRAIGKDYERTFASKIYQSCIDHDAVVDFEKGHTPGRGVSFTVLPPRSEAKPSGQDQGCFLSTLS